MKKVSMMKKYIAKIVAAVVLFLLVICQNWAAENKVTVFAAASLTNALNDIVTQYEKDHNTKIIAAYASSSTLARQIEQGAPADILSLLTNNGWIMCNRNNLWLMPVAILC